MENNRMNDINKTIKHFESLQKRYTTQHNGQMCERVSDALEALYRFKRQEDFFKDMFDNMSCYTHMHRITPDEI